MSGAEERFPRSWERGPRGPGLILSAGGRPGPTRVLRATYIEG